jgi:hypothetical protein
MPTDWQHCPGKVSDLDLFARTSSPRWYGTAW